MIGYGNPGRIDDGLGPALSALLDARALKGVSVETDYQLVVDHAHEIARHDYVIFADAAISGQAPFSFTEIPIAATQPTFNSHSLSPEAAMFFARTMFGAKTKGYILGIRGYEYEGFGEGISERAKENLDAAFLFILELLGQGKRIS
ncbi:MAG: hydrogenase maturation protease [Nitrospinae bacterium]|nr:hydrogenase maturation protease [Nitrospinota bacterium]